MRREVVAVSKGERPLGAENDVLVQFARDLRLLRERAGAPTYRELSARVHYSAAALSEAASGRKLPSLPVTRAYVAGCGGDTAEWEARWRTIAVELGTSKSAARNEDEGVKSPYVGLTAFQQTDTDRFFGRDTFVTELLTRLRQVRFLGVFGSSGCGKSSLLRAGVAAHLATGREQDDLPVVVFTPGQHPLEECAIHLARALGESPGTLRDQFSADPRNLHLRIRQAATDSNAESDAVLVVDQFEELFTLCIDDQERTAFVDTLVEATADPASRTRVILGVRADFLGHCGQHPRLVSALREAQVLVGPMTTEELRLAITGPAEQAGYRVEGALTARLIADATKQSGTLPLVSHALLQTWQHRQGKVMTVAGYEAVGGIEHALARTAEQTYQSLDPDQQDLAQQVFLRLTALGEGTEDTKRRLRRNEMSHGDSEITHTLDTLTRARLIIVDHDAVEISHEALIRHWPRLRDWLVTDREFLAWREELAQRRHHWDRVGRDHKSLLRGVALARAQDWRGRRGTDLSAGERLFIARSHAQERRGAWAWRAVSALAVVVALVVGLLAIQAARGRDELAVALRNVNATLLSQEATRSSEPTLAGLQIAQAAWRESPGNPNALGALWAQYMQWRTIDKATPSGMGPPAPNLVGTQDGSSDGDVIAEGGGGTTITVWQGARTNRTRQTRVTAPSAVNDLDVSPDGKWVAASSEGGELTLWSVDGRAGPSRSWKLPHREGNEARALWFSADSRYLAVAWRDVGVVELWDVASRQVTFSSLHFPKSTELRAASMPGGKTVLMIPSGADGGSEMSLRDVATGAVLRTFSLSSAPLNDGTAVADCELGTLRVRDTVSGADRTPAPTPRCTPQDPRGGLSSRVDRTGQFVRIDDDGTWGPSGIHTYLHWSSGRRYTITIALGGSMGINGYGSLTSDGGFALVATISDGLVRFNAPSSTPLPGQGEFNPADATSAIDPNGNTWVSVDDDQLVLFDAATGTERARVPAPAPAPNSGGNPTVQFMPDGARVVAASRQEMRVYRAANLELERVIKLPRASDVLPKGAQLLASPSIAALTNDEIAVVDRNRLSWWQLDSGRLLADPVRLSMEPPLQPEGPPSTLLARPGHRGQVIIGTRAQLVIWDVVQRRQIAAIPIHDTSFFSARPGLMAVNRTGSRLAVRNSEQNMIDQWNLETMKPLPSFPSDADRVVGFSGDLLVLEGNEGIQLWRADDIPTRLGEAKLNLDTHGGVYLHKDMLAYDRFLSPEPGIRLMEPTRLPLEPQAWFQRLCEINNRDFTAVELTRLPQNANRTHPCI